MGSAQQFCLKWNNHQANLLSVFERLLSNEALVDVTLACEGLSLKAHKMVLSACSPFFETLFVENPCKHPIVILKDMRYMDLKAIVEFMYRGEVNVPQDQLSTLLKTAETLKVKGLAEVTSESKRHGNSNVVVDDSGKNAVTSRPESPSSKRKRGRPRRRSPTDSNKSDSEDQGPPASRIKAPLSPEIVEDGSLSSDRLIAPSVVPASPARAPVVAASPARTPVLSTALSSSSGSTNKVVPVASNSVVPVSQPLSRDSVAGGDDTGVEADDVDFEVEPSILMEQSMTTDNVPVFTDAASSSQAAAAALASESQHSHHSLSTSDGQSRVPVHASLPSEITTEVDVKPDISTLVPFNNQQPQGMSMVPVQTSEASGDSSSGAMMFMDTSGVQAIAGPSSYQPDQQATPSHGPYSPEAASFDYNSAENGALLKDWEQEEGGEQPDMDSEEGVEGRHKLSCPSCPFETRVRASYSRHMRMHARRPLSCSLCDAHYLDQASLARHMTTHSGGKWALLSCPECGTHFTRRDTLDEHMRMHAEKDKPFKCSLCEESFMTYKDMQAHKAGHGRKPPHVCEICGKGYLQLGTLAEHRFSHEEERRFACPICGKRFFSSMALKRHNRVHTGERPFRCTICGLNFVIRAHLLAHKRTHTGERPFRCPSNACPQAFSTSSAAKRHFLNIHSKNAANKSAAAKLRNAASDDSGDYILGDLSTLETEAPSEGKQAEGTPHVCQQCGASFRSRAALNGHKLAHVGLRPFPCPACPRAFSSSGAAARHLRNIHKRSPVFDSVLPDVPQEQQLSGDTEAC